MILGRKPMAPSCWPGSRVLKPPTRGWHRKGPKWQGTSRRVGVGSQILKALGVGKMRLLSSPRSTMPSVALVWKWWSTSANKRPYG